MQHSALMLALAAALLPPLPAAAQRLGPEAVRGRALYATLGCDSCHGTVGQGGAGPRLAPAPKPLAFITAYVRAPAGDMPPFSKTLASDADMAAIHAYLASIPPPAGGPGKP